MGIVAKYKFDGSVYADLLPEFNAEFTDYTVTDEVDSENSNHIIRTIESNSLPTLMRFGTTHEGVGGEGKSSLLEIIKLDTSNLTSMYCMFRDCAYVTSINTDGWNTSKITDMTSIFNGCGRLISLDLSNLDTSSAIYFKKMFIGCSALTSIDTSIWKTNKVIDTLDMFRDCTKLKLLDISNYDLTNVTLSSEMFTGTENLTDIGMIYCDQSTINKVASLLPTDHNITIWVESDDILQYDQYDHITYKTQKVQDTVHLNSPLLKGDTIEVIDGKTYHVHRWEKVVLDGSEDWQIQNTYQENNTVCFMCSNLPYSKKAGELNFTNDRFINYGNYPLQTEIFKEGFSINTSAEYGRFAYIRLDISRLPALTSDNFKQWLRDNPTTVVYELATPYYELISEEPLELTLLDTTDNTINNNSILPSNMTIANKELSTIAIKPSTTYTLSFDKSNVDSEVTIDICGGEQITTVLNRVELTTPSELGSGIRFISSDGCIISNVRLLEGSLVKEAIPKETFEGLQSSFEDGYIIGENLANDKEDYFYDEFGHWGNGTILFKQNLKANTTYTLVRKISNIKYGVLNGVSFYDMAYYTDGTSKQDHNCWYGKDGWYISKYTPTKDVTKFAIIVGNDNSSGTIRPRITISDYMIFEGDHTHLSEAELMRYIEKGTSHYEEEDYNHVGKYKVQYKVTGKNKVNNDTLVLGTIQAKGVHQDFNKGVYCSQYIPIDITKQYIMSMTGFHVSETHYAVQYDKDKKYLGVLWGRGLDYTFSKECKYLRIGARKTNADTIITEEEFNNTLFQIEEGAVATEYEPYKEDIKTYYLSSPLLEGDTIEDVNGVATHVKRYEKVILDGGESWDKYNQFQFDTTFAVLTAFNDLSIFKSPKAKIDNIYEVNYFTKAIVPIQPGAGVSIYDMEGTYFRPDVQLFYYKVNKSRLSTVDLNGFEQWLQANPTTVVYELASPIYEPISTESILLDSYVNGHLDLSNENIPIQKTEFRNFTKELAYLQPSTDYVVKFSSDNIGIAKVYLDSSVKEINVVKGINEVIITTPSTIVNNNIIIDGIGFNVSDVQVIANAIKDGDIKDFDYFKGLQSSFEDGLVTDENDENYGKYKVECKIVGKNKFELDGDVTGGVVNHIRSEPILKKGITYTISHNCKQVYDEPPVMSLCDKSGASKHSYFLRDSSKYTFTALDDIYNIYLYSNGFSYVNSTNNSMTFSNIQIEEGTQATPYESYKESIHTLYLNSPLLKGDKLVVHDGKLCHYHKMGMVVLDGSEDEYWSKAGIYIPFIVIRNVGLKPNGNMGHDSTKGKMHTNILQPNIITSTTETDNRKGIYVVGSGEYNEIRIRLTDNDTVNSVKQWLQQNPTTVVYELAEPYYEPIEPQLSQYSFSTVKDGDMEIITVLPIEKINLTYRTDINGVSSIEEQIASIQEGTDISSIIDEEVDE